MEQEEITLNQTEGKKKSTGTTWTKILGLCVAFMAVGVGVGFGSAFATLKKKGGNDAISTESSSTTAGKEVSARFFVIGDWGRADNGYPKKDDGSPFPPGYAFAGRMRH